MSTNTILKKNERVFLPEDFTLQTWSDIEPFFKELLDRKIDSLESLELWLLHQSELESVVSEDACWRQIKMTCDTENKALEDSFNYFCLQIQPYIQPYADALNKKLLASPFLSFLPQDKYFTYIRSVKKSIELFREINIPIQSELAVLQQQYGQITGAMTIEVNGEQYTLQQAAKFLESKDRILRESVYFKIQQRRLQDKETLNTLSPSISSRTNKSSITTETLITLQSSESSSTY